MNLLDLLRRIAAESTHAAGSPERIAEINAAISQYRTEHPDEAVDLTVLDTQGVELFEELRAGDLTGPGGAAVLADLQGLADVCDAIREVAAADATVQQQIADQAAALATRVSGEEPETPADPSAVDLPGGDDPIPPGEPLPAGDPAPAADPALVAAARPPRVPLGRLPNHRRRDPQRPRGPHTWRAAADIHGLAAGSELTEAEQLVLAAQTRLHSFDRGRVGRRQQAGIATIDRRGKYGAEFDLRDSDVTHELLNRVTDETRLEGGSLVAAGGWCAPSEILYDLLPGADANAGMINIPGMTTPRGGIRWPLSPSFATLYAAAATSFYQTEATVIAGATPKPCYEIPCTTFSEERLGVAGVCVRTPILTERGYPELVTATLSEIMAVHAHKVNARKIADMVTDSTANTITAGQMDVAGYSASLLTAIELQVEHLRYRHRWTPNITMEAVLPLWSRGTLRADLASRNGQPFEIVTDAMVVAHLRSRGINPQWVYDWQDAFATGVVTDFGGTTLPKNFPTTLTILIYRAGTYFVAESDVITIDGLYDSELLETNMHLALFTEEGFAIGKRDWPAIALTIPVCPGGETGMQIDVCGSTTATTD